MYIRSMANRNKSKSQYSNETFTTNASSVPKLIETFIFHLSIGQEQNSFKHVE